MFLRFCTENGRDRGAAFALSEYTKMPEYQEKFGATVFKITRDAQGSRLTHLKVTGGVLKARNLLSGHKQNKAEDIWEER